ncbi:hypothetical protein [Glaciecola sp. 1036]|uniref:hypothetical protein n=1 Tax=Alteromonadaceae TaxID=72275 RepID=UPI003D072DBA
MPSDSQESVFTNSVKNLLRDFHDPSDAEDSAIGVALAYFNELEGESKAKMSNEANTGEGEKLRIARLANIIYIATQLLKLTEGKNWKETQVQSSRLLGTLFLLSSYDGPKARRLHQRMKPIYKAVLSVRLLDGLLAKDKITHPYILKHFDSKQRYFSPETEYTEFQQFVVLPMIIANLIQDVGLFHPKCREILYGKSGDQDEFRVLDKEDRILLLRLNYKATMDYLTKGLGKEKYIGNSKQERIVFNQQQDEQMEFMEDLLKGALSPKDGVGNLIKIPQVYTSVVLSTKAKMDLMDLPKAIFLIDQLAKSGSVDAEAAKTFIKIVGQFPQGFGVVYCQPDHADNPPDKYEYAIVNQLNPEKLREPLCRAVTRSLQFTSSGTNLVVTTDANLYFPSARDLLSKISKERLEEILSLLYKESKHGGERELLPHCWNVYDFFSEKRFQNLWNKSTTKTV